MTNHSDDNCSPEASSSLYRTVALAVSTTVASTTCPSQAIAMTATSTTTLATSPHQTLLVPASSKSPVDTKSSPVQVLQKDTFLAIMPKTPPVQNYCSKGSSAHRLVSSPTVTRTAAGGRCETLTAVDEGETASGDLASPLHSTPATASTAATAGLPLIERGLPVTPVRSRERHSADDSTGISATSNAAETSSHVAVASQRQFAVVPTMSPWTYSTPAAQRLDEASLRMRLREAYCLIKEKEYNLIKAATIGQELLESNQELQAAYEVIKCERDELLQALTAGRFEVLEGSNGSDSHTAPNNHHQALSEVPRKKRKHQDPGSLDDQELGANHDDSVEMCVFDNRRRSMAPLRNRRQSTVPYCEHSMDNGLNTDSIKDLEARWRKQHVVPLEAQISMLREQCDEITVDRNNLRSELATLTHTFDQVQRHATDVEKKLALANSEIDRERQRAEDSEVALARIQSERTRQRLRDEQQRDDAKRKGHMFESEFDKALGEIRQLRDALQQANERQHELIRELRHVERQNSEVREKYEQLRCEIAEEWEPMRERYAECEEQLEVMREGYESLQDAYAEARSKLDEYEARKESELGEQAVDEKAARKGTSLLGELDGKRQLAEEAQRRIAREKHDLQKAYTLTKRKQSRMRQQISRLSQLASGAGSEARVKRLEAMLGDLDGERQMLLQWIDKHRNAGVSPSATYSQSLAQFEDGSSDNEGSVHRRGSMPSVSEEALQLQLKQATMELERAKRELKSMMMLRVNDVARIRELERELITREERLRKVGGELTGLKYELSELQMRLRANQQQKPGSDSKSGTGAISSVPSPAQSEAAKLQGPCKAVSPAGRARSADYDGNPDNRHCGKAMSLEFMMNTTDGGGNLAGPLDGSDNGRGQTAPPGSQNGGHDVRLTPSQKMLRHLLGIRSPGYAAKSINESSDTRHHPGSTFANADDVGVDYGTNRPGSDSSSGGGGVSLEHKSKGAPKIEDIFVSRRDRQDTNECTTQ